ncbi:MAG: DMT family transporter [Lachnospiraceae bacterium]|nr:DMT family transporter [Lachnospiraceae bacterium]
MNKFVLRQSLLLLLTAAIWGVAFVAQSVGMDYVQPFTFNAVRNVIGGAVLLPVIFFLDGQKAHRGKTKTAYLSSDPAKQSDTQTVAQADMQTCKQTEAQTSMQTIAQTDMQTKAQTGKQTETQSESSTELGVSSAFATKDLLAGGFSCGVILFLASSLQQFGIQYTSVGKAGFITAMYIVLVPIFGIFLHKKTGLRVWIAVAMAVAGLYLLCMTGDSLALNRGDALVLLCAVAFTFHILVIDHFSSRVDGVKMSCIQFFTCGLLSAIGMLLFETPQISQILAAWMPILYAGVMSCGVAYTLQIVGQRGMNPTVASLILSLESVISLLSGWVILHQSLSGRELAGCLIMFAAIILVQLPGGQKEVHA